MKEICTDLEKEYEELDTIVAALDEAGWNVMTPAEGWTVKATGYSVSDTAGFIWYIGAGSITVSPAF